MKRECQPKAEARRSPLALSVSAWPPSRPATTDARRLATRARSLAHAHTHIGGDVDVIDGRHTVYTRGDHTVIWHTLKGCAEWIVVLG